MRGGGVCWLSTALWRAALAAGLRTDVRENHYGFVAALGGGLDATNTLVIRNDSDVPVTVRAWMDEDQVYVTLYADGSLGRTSTVRGPERLSSGRYVAYQDIAWDDGPTTTNEFVSRYNW
jgi:vancomycin resistance protein YoaR